MTGADEFADSKAQALLDAHVAWVVQGLRGERLRTGLKTRLDGFLGDAARLRLSDVISVESVQQTAVDYAVDMKIGGAIPALVGDIAVAIHEHPIHDQTTLQELVPDREFEELLDKLLEMQQLRENIIQQSVSNPVFANLAAQLLYSGLRGYVAQGRRLAARVPGGRAAIKLGRVVIDRAPPQIGSALDRGIRRYVQHNTKAQIQASRAFLQDAFESDELRRAVLDFWDDHKHRSVACVRDVAGQLDIDELFVIGYEYWQHLRHTPLYRQLIESGVAVFFDTYRDTTLTELLDEIGVTRDMIIRDGLRFLPQVIDALQAQGLLEPAIRRQFEDFYRSEAVAAILQ